MNGTNYRRAAASLAATAAGAIADHTCATGDVAHSQAWPSKPIHYVGSYANGGTSDMIVRAITPGL